MSDHTVSNTQHAKRVALVSFADKVDAEIKEAIGKKKKTKFGFLRPRDFAYVKGCLRKEAVSLLSIVGTNLFQTILTGMKAIALLAFVQLLLEGDTKNQSELSVLGLTFSIPFQGISDAENDQIVIVFGILVVLMLASAGLMFFTNHLSVLLQNRLAFHIRKDLVKKLLSLDISYFSETKMGEIQFLQNQSVSRFSAIVQATQMFVMSTLNLGVTVAILIKMSASFTLFLGTAGMLFFLVISQFSHRVVIFGREQAQKGRAMESAFFDMLHGVRLIKQGSQEDAAQRTYLERTWESHEITRKLANFQQFVRGVSEVGGTMVLILVAVVFSFLLDLTLLGDRGFTVGYFFIALQALMSVKQLIDARMKQAQAIPQITFLTRFLDMEEHGLELAQSGERHFKGVKSGLNVAGVTFGYTATKPVLQNFSGDFPCGTITALVGLSGSGKTTLLELLAGFQFPTDGRILIDEVSMSDFDIGSFRKQVGYVTQDSIVFHDTVMRNIRYFRPDAAACEIEEASRLACVSEFIGNLDAGLETIVGEHGALISGGQRQRIALARALVQQPSILLLDEATSAMDLQTESEIYMNLHAIKQNKVIVVSAHRLCAIKNVDNILVISEGRVVAQGCHDQLIMQEGLYRHLYMVQELGHGSHI